jgi:hypothetical protein
MPRSTSLPDFPLNLDLLLRSAWIAVVIGVLWESTNLYFEIFISKVFFHFRCFIAKYSQIPACQGVLLSDISDDPTGTLITGIQNRERPFTQVNLRA